ncbi:MAG: hypothetical protein HY699_03850 [Deltaproteobacteria bacterium]|nr:hypothetical protein [Deltaproteobacteria bacterium]
MTITSPRQGDVVEVRALIEGCVENPKLHVYVLVRPLAVGGWWVQPASPVDRDGKWRVLAYFGTEEAGRGEYFEIVAVASTEAKLLREGQRLSANDLESLREHHEHSDVVLTVRK